MVLNGYILGNDTYTGSMTLQKTFVSDHISKKKCFNRGELPMYLVENSHEPIIDKETFEAVQAEIQHRKRTISGDSACGRAASAFTFTGLIRCGKCGAPYKRKHANAGSKYEKIVWICDTFDTLGKNDCDSQQIPENILMAKAAEALGLETFDEAVLREKVKMIQVPGHNRLTFIFRNGHSVEAEWQHPSRRDSWTPEMRQAARERQLRHKRERRTEPDEQQ